jgi:signal transduction histidine kinase
LKRADGLYRWHLIRVMPIKNETGELQLWVGTATDIEELRLLQQQKDDFISIASHELKTPLTSLKAALQLLDRMKDNPSPKMLPMITLANKSLAKVNVLVEDLLNASKLNEGQLSISPKNFILANVITESCQYHRGEGIYTITTKGDMDVEVYADAVRIDQIMINFITNAIKYAPDSKLIEILIEKTNGMAKVSVKDSGVGIPAEKQCFLFDRYYRVNNSGSQYTGLGLGLYICAEIIKVHNGEIGVISENGKGRTFWFTLPVAYRSVA